MSENRKIDFQTPPEFPEIPVVEAAPDTPSDYSGDFEKLGESFKALSKLHRETLRSLEGLDALGELAALNRLDSLEKLSSLNELGLLKELKSLKNLKQLENLKSMDKALQNLKELKSLDKLGELGKLEELAHIDKTVDKLEKVMPIDKLNKLMGSHVQTMEELKKLEDLSYLGLLEKLERLCELQELERLNELGKLEKLELLKEEKVMDNLEKLNVLSIFKDGPLIYILKSFTNAFLDLTKVVALAGLVFYALSFESTQIAGARAMSFLGFGGAARANLALNIIAQQNNPEQLELALGLAKERALSDMDSFFSASDGNILTPYTQRKLQDFTKYSFKSESFDLKEFLNKEAKKRLQAQKENFVQHFKYEKEKGLFGSQEAGMERLKDEVLKGNFNAALEISAKMPSNTFRSLPYAKRVALYSLYQQDPEALDKAITNLND